MCKLLPFQTASAAHPPTWRFLFLRKQIFPFFGFVLDLLYQARIAFKLRFDGLNTLAHTVLAHTDITELIPENQHTATYLLHCPRYGRNRILYRLHQLLDRCFQFTEQSIVRLDLTIDFTAVGDNTLFLQRTGNHTIVNGGLYTDGSKNIVVISETHSFEFVEDVRKLFHNTFSEASEFEV